MPFSDQNPIMGISHPGQVGIKGVKFQGPYCILISYPLLLWTMAKEIITASATSSVGLTNLGWLLHTKRPLSQYLTLILGQGDLLTCRDLSAT